MKDIGESGNFIMGTLGVILLLVLVVVFSYGSGSLVEKTNMRQQATEAGAAHWSIDHKTGEKKFVWDGKLTKDD